MRSPGGKLLRNSALSGENLIAGVKVEQKTFATAEGNDAENDETGEKEKNCACTHLRFALDASSPAIVAKDQR